MDPLVRSYPLSSRYIKTTVYYGIFALMIVTFFFEASGTQLWAHGPESASQERVTLRNPSKMPLVPEVSPSTSTATCTPVYDRSSVLALLRSRHPANPMPPSDAQRTHLDAVFSAIDLQGECLRELREASRKAPPSSEKLFFIDLGSRELDQTKLFLQRFPRSEQYNVFCFEANPKFRSLYSAFASRAPCASFHYFNVAAGIRNETLFLSERNVGSSVIQEKGVISGVPVPVIDFSEFLASIVPSDSLTHVVLKMDIEKMEFALLDHMIKTGTIALVDELLLECHYNTNKVRRDRNLTVDIGIDDCRTLVAELNNLFHSQHFEVVLWNSRKTAKASGYSSRHGGFSPT